MGCFTVKQYKPNKLSSSSKPWRPHVMPSPPGKLSNLAQLLTPVSDNCYLITELLKISIKHWDDILLSEPTDIKISRLTKEKH